MSEAVNIKVSNCKEIRSIVKDYVSKGWRIETGGKHKKLVSPDSSRFVAINGSPSCGYAAENFLRDIKKVEKMLNNNAHH